MEQTRVITPLYSTTARPRAKTQVDLPSSQTIYPRILFYNRLQLSEHREMHFCATKERLETTLNFILSIKQSRIEFTKEKFENYHPSKRHLISTLSRQVHHKFWEI